MGNSVIWGLVAIGGVVVACVSLPGVMRAVGRFLARAVLLSFAVFLINLALRPFGWDIGLNPATAAVAGVLGVPGVAAMFVAKAMLL